MTRGLIIAERRKKRKKRTLLGKQVDGHQVEPPRLSLDLLLVEQDWSAATAQSARSVIPHPNGRLMHDLPAQHWLSLHHRILDSMQQ